MLIRGFQIKGFFFNSISASVLKVHEWESLLCLFIQMINPSLDVGVICRPFFSKDNSTSCLHAGRGREVLLPLCMNKHTADTGCTGGRWMSMMRTPAFWRNSTQPTCWAGAHTEQTRCLRLPLTVPAPDSQAEEGVSLTPSSERVNSPPLLTELREVS